MAARARRKRIWSSASGFTMWRKPRCTKLRNSLTARPSLVPDGAEHGTRLCRLERVPVGIYLERLPQVVSGAGIFPQDQGDHAGVIEEHGIPGAQGKCTLHGQSGGCI